MRRLETGSAPLMRVGTSNTGRHMLALTALLTCMPSVTAGQSLIVDEGSFEITIAGRLAGTEDFVIRRSGSGLNSQTIATAEITIAVPEGRSDLRPALQMVGGGMAVSAYQMKLSGTREEEVFVTVAPDRFLLKITFGARRAGARATRGAWHTSFGHRCRTSALLPLPAAVSDWSVSSGHCSPAG